MASPSLQGWKAPNATFTTTSNNCSSSPQTIEDMIARLRARTYTESPVGQEPMEYSSSTNSISTEAAQRAPAAPVEPPLEPIILQMLAGGDNVIPPTKVSVQAFSRLQCANVYLPTIVHARGNDRVVSFYFDYFFQQVESTGLWGRLAVVEIMNMFVSHLTQTRLHLIATNPIPLLSKVLLALLLMHVDESILSRRCMQLIAEIASNEPLFITATLRRTVLSADAWDTLLLLLVQKLDAAIVSSSSGSRGTKIDHVTYSTSILQQTAELCFHDLVSYLSRLIHKTGSAVTSNETAASAKETSGILSHIIVEPQPCQPLDIWDVLSVEVSVAPRYPLLELPSLGPAPSANGKSSQSTQPRERGEHIHTALRRLITLFYSTNVFPMIEFYRLQSDPYMMALSMVLQINNPGGDWIVRPVRNNHDGAGPTRSLVKLRDSLSLRYKSSVQSLMRQFGHPMRLLVKNWPKSVWISGIAVEHALLGCLFASPSTLLQVQVVDEKDFQPTIDILVRGGAIIVDASVKMHTLLSVHTEGGKRQISVVRSRLFVGAKLDGVTIGDVLRNEPIAPLRVAMTSGSVVMTLDFILSHVHGNIQPLQPSTTDQLVELAIESGFGMRWRVFEKERLIAKQLQLEHLLRV